MPEARFKTRELSLSGRLRTANDPTTIGPTDLSVCKNMRPWDQYPRGIGGQTKINTAALASTGVRNGFHFRKALPVEYHVLAWTSDGKVWVNDTAAPSAGAFDGTVLFTDTTGGTTGRFAPTPTGALAYANGKEACLWGGTEHRCAGFIDYPTTAQAYDYSDVITNTKTDAGNVATIHPANTAIDANALLLLPLNNNVTDDSPTTSHTVTNTNVTYSTSVKKFGTHSAYFNGSTANLSIPDNADFDFSGGIWSVDFWIKSAVAAGYLYYHQTDANNYMAISIDSSSNINLKIVAASSTVITLTSSTSLTVNWSHISVVENGNNYYIFINGQLTAYTSDTDRAANYTGTVYIGSDASSGNWFTGYVDEYRVSNSARWVASFSPPSDAYGTGYSSISYIGSIMPLDGFKITVGTANAVASTMAVDEWNGTGWVSVSSLSDGTTAGGISLAQTGSVTFTSTASTSKPTQVEKLYLYWYRVSISAAATFGNPTISNITLSIPFQTIKDIWDGEERPCNAFIGYHSSAYTDFTTNVLENGYSSTGSTVDATTYANVGGYTTTSYLYAGFIERMAGITLYIVDGKGNTASVVATISYWDGTAWVAMSGNDGTVDTSRTLAKTGWFTWPSRDRQDEFKRTDLGSGTTTDINTGGGINPSHTTAADRKSTGALYFYRISFSGALSANTDIYHVAGIPAPKTIRGYSFPVLHQNRVALVCNTDDRKNSVLMSAFGTSNVFNGLDSYEYGLGQEEAFVSAASLFLRFGSSVQDMMVLCKQGETWLLEGNGAENDPYRARIFSEKIGCVAPLTMVSVPTGEEISQGIRRSFAVWQSQRGIELFEGTNLMLISEDIRDKFDPRSANYAATSSCSGFYDPVYDEYHWVVPGSQEWVFSFKYKKWYQIVRGTAKYLYGGVPVMDTSGTSYTYGFDNAGYVYRLENGTDFDGVDIVHTLKTGCIALNENRVSEDTTLRMVKVVQVAKTTANSMTVTHFGDSATTGNSIGSFVPSATGKRLCSRVLNAQSKGPHVHHEFQLELTTDDQTYGCEPIYIIAYYDGERQDVR